MGSMTTLLWFMMWSVTTHILLIHSLDLRLPSKVHVQYMICVIMDTIINIPLSFDIDWNTRFADIRPIFLIWNYSPYQMTTIIKINYTSISLNIKDKTLVSLIDKNQWSGAVTTCNNALKVQNVTYLFTSYMEVTTLKWRGHYQSDAMWCKYPLFTVCYKWQWLCIFYHTRFVTAMMIGRYEHTYFRLLNRFLQTQIWI